MYVVAVPDVDIRVTLHDPFFKRLEALEQSCKVVVVPEVNTRGALHGALSGKLEPLGEMS